jgi:hypothetical protein
MPEQAVQSLPQRPGLGGIALSRQQRRPHRGGTIGCFQLAPMLGEPRAVEQEVFVQGLEQLQELLPEEERPKPPGECGLNVQQGVLPVDEPEERCRLSRDVDDSL